MTQEEQPKPTCPNCGKVLTPIEYLKRKCELCGRSC